MEEIVLLAVLGILLLNVVAALVASITRGAGDHWILVILLASTSAAAIIAVLAVLTETPRLAEVSLVFTATAAVTAAVRLAARRGRRDADGRGRG